MTDKKRKPKKIKRKLLDKYRLMILNENTFEERLSFKLTRLNVFVMTDKKKKPKKKETKKDLDNGHFFYSINVFTHCIYAA